MEDRDLELLRIAVYRAFDLMQKGSFPYLSLPFGDVIPEQVFTRLQRTLRIERHPSRKWHIRVMFSGNEITLCSARHVIKGTPQSPLDMEQIIVLILLSMHGWTFTLAQSCWSTHNDSNRNIHEVRMGYVSRCSSHFSTQRCSAQAEA